MRWGLIVFSLFFLVGCGVKEVSYKDPMYQNSRSTLWETITE